MNYAHTTLTLACKHNGTTHCTIDAHVAENGLAYHLAHYADHNGPFWSVTHVKSGHVLCNETTQFKNELQCQHFIECITNMGDWAQEKPAPSEDIKVAIRRIAMDCRASYIYTTVF